MAPDDGDSTSKPTTRNASAPAMTLRPSTEPSAATQQRAVILLSGGLDSTTTLAIAREQGYLPHAITFRYGQRHEQEVELAKTIAERFEVVRHAVVDIDLRQFGGSALTADLDVPKRASVNDIGADIPITYVPARNTIFLSFALAFAEVAEARDIFIGVNSLDYSGYPDCRPGFVAAFQQLANLATKTGTETDGFTIHAPLIELTKAQIIRRGVTLGVDYSLTTSCYDPTDSGLACGHCEACLLRRKGFTDNGLTDPIDYASSRYE